MAAEPITHILFQAVTKLEPLYNDEHAAALQHESDDMDLPRKKNIFSTSTGIKYTGRIQFRVLTTLPFIFKGP